MEVDVTMTNVLALAPGRDVTWQFDVRAVRAEYGLSILEAATAAGVSASSIEDMERKSQASISSEGLRRKYELFTGTGGAAGKNLIFGHYPLRMAREILDLSVDEMARVYGYSVNSWKRIEANARPLRREVLERIEQQVREKFTAVCAVTA